MRCLTARLALGPLLLLFVTSPAFANNVTATVTAAELGQTGDRTSYGARPAIAFYLPVSRALRAARFRANLQVSPAVDGGSTITVSSSGTPIFATTVQEIHRHNFIDLPIPIPESPARVLDVSISGAFAHVDDERCSRYDPSAMFLIVKKGAAFAVRSDDAASNTIAGFLEYYGGDVGIVVSNNAPAERKRAAVRLAYMVEQIYRWRHASVTLRSSVDRNARNIVLGDFHADLAARGNVLEVGPNGIDLLTRQIDPLLITASVDSAQFGGPLTDLRASKRLSLADIGMSSESQGGGNPTFSIPFNLRRVGELPLGLHVYAAISHTAIAGSPHANADITINGALVDSIPLDLMHGQQPIEAAIPDELVSGTNDVRIAVNYDSARDCRSSDPTFTTTLFDTTRFQWDDVTTYTPSVGDFARSLTGHVVVLVNDDSAIPYAFSLLNLLGTGNTNVGSIDVLPFTGTIPPGYDAAIVVAPLEKLGTWPLPLSSAGSQFKLRRSAPLLAARFANAFGVLETLRVGSVPTLVASYRGNVDAVDGLSSIGFTTIAQQTDDVFIFRGSQGLYASTAPRIRNLPQPFLSRAAWPIAAAIVVLVLIVITLSRRKRRAGPAA